MAYEVEQKFVVGDPDALVTAVRRLGGEFGAPVAQTDRYLRHPSRDLAATDEAFRVRKDGAANAITYKGPKLDQATKTREEIELALEPGDAVADQAARMMEKLGFATAAFVKKQRRTATVTWRARAIEIALDDVETLGRYAELEIIVEDQRELASARDELIALAGELGLHDVERRGYIQLVLARAE